MENIINKNKTEKEIKQKAEHERIRKALLLQNKQALENIKSNKDKQLKEIIK